MNWQAFLAAVRSDLKDTAATPKYSDALVYLYATDAIRDYSQWFPKRVDRYEPTLSGESYTLPSDFVEAVAVESPKDRFLVERGIRPGAKYLPINNALYYYVDAGNLYLIGSPHDDGVFLSYYAVHDLPVDENDNSFVFSVPEGDMELLRLYVKAKCFEQLRGRTASLDRFKLQSGPRNDNPIEPETEDLMGAYYRKVAERLKGRAIYLHRTGRRR